MRNWTDPWFSLQSQICYPRLDRLFSPAGANVVACQRLALLREVIGVEYGQRAVDVALHGVSGVVSVWVHRERPVVHQPWNHV